MYWYKLQIKWENKKFAVVTWQRVYMPQYYCLTKLFAIYLLFLDIASCLHVMPIKGMSRPQDRCSSCISVYLVSSMKLQRQSRVLSSLCSATAAVMRRGPVRSRVEPVLTISWEATQHSEEESGMKSRLSYSASIPDETLSNECASTRRGYAHSIAEWRVGCHTAVTSDSGTLYRREYSEFGARLDTNLY
jgi:hypothetical protein